MKLTAVSERVWIEHDPTSGYNTQQCDVTLARSEDVEPAIATLNKAVVFDRRISIARRTEEHHVGIDRRFRVGFQRGWFASRDPDILRARLREPLLAYPFNLFAPLRESRRVVLENLPYPLKAMNLLYSNIYSLLHGYNILGSGSFFRYKPRNPKLSGWAIKLDFTTKAEADEAILTYDGQMVGGRPVQMSISKPPMRYTAVSWDGGRSGSHNSSRDR